MFNGTDASRTSRYSITVDGDVSDPEYRGATIDNLNEIDGSTVNGAVDTGDIDTYWFEGTIDDFKLAGNAELEIEYDVR